MTALAVFILIVCIILFWGYNRSIAEWNQEKQSGIEEYARAVSNIMANAVRHADSEGLVRLEIDKDETNKVVISLFNSGAPIPEEEINRVFDRLFRGEYARNTPGSGLGLTIARKITELHGGTIAIRSRNDYGTTVVLTM